MAYERMIGREVKVSGKETGKVLRWEPLSSGMCDTLVRIGSTEVWCASHALVPLDGYGPLPSRREAQEDARRGALAQLQTIRCQHIRDFRVPWPGAEHGKAILGKAIDRSIEILSEATQRHTP